MVHIFIINAYAGNTRFSAGLRNHLAQRKDIQYYILHTRKREDEIALAREVMTLFEGEDIRFYCCGGSGTFRNVMAGIDDLSKVEFAFYPKGLTNDFLKVFGEDEKYFHDIDNLIDGKAQKIDYIKTNHGVALNTFSLGLDTVQVSKTSEYHTASVFGKDVPYFLGFVAAVFNFTPYELEMNIEGQRHVGHFTEVFFGNGFVIGGSLYTDTGADYTDGLGRMVYFKSMGVFKRIKALLRCANKKTDDIGANGYAGYINGFSVKRRDGMPITVDFDGELQEPQREWTVEIVNKGLNFVIPKGVN